MAGPFASRYFSVSTSLPDGASNDVSGLALNPTGSVLYVANSASDMITAVDVRTGQVAQAVVLEDRSLGYSLGQLVLDAASSTLFVAVVSPAGVPGFVLAINASSFSVEEVIRTLVYPGGLFEPYYLAADPSSRQVFAENLTGGGVVAINESGLYASFYLGCPATPCISSGLSAVGPLGLLVVPTGTREVAVENSSNDRLLYLLTGPAGSVTRGAVFDGVSGRLIVGNVTSASAGGFLEFNLSNRSFADQRAGAPPSMVGFLLDAAD
ncbi:MAG: hypothetical protein L3K09_08580, partial [Thermoplasmata archaeon]|nr:hypothetical protein [Thermoplasmata archaeon]